MVESEKGRNSVNISWNSLKIYSGRLNINPNLYAKYQNQNSRGSEDIALTRAKDGHNNISRNTLKGESGYLNINPKSYAKYQYPSLSGSQDIVLTRFLL